MQWIEVIIQPESGFATPLKGDTLFGQLCWTIREMEGESALVQLLEGYTDARPFAVISDAMPKSVLPRPAVPACMLGWANQDARMRKSAKQRAWMPVESAQKPLSEWGSYLLTAREVLERGEGNSKQSRISKAIVAPHNTLNRITNSTGTGLFAPFTARQTWYAPELPLVIYMVLDTDRACIDQVKGWFQNLGLFGVGKDATTGMGKFRLISIQVEPTPGDAGGNAFLTLAPCAPQGGEWAMERCFYQIFTRFGRHGAQMAVAGYPYKNPVLLAETGALLTPSDKAETGRVFVGSGLGGGGELSRILSSTVHQGYAPVVRLNAA